MTLLRESSMELLDWGMRQLSFLGGDETRSEAETLLAEVCGRARYEIYLEGDQPLEFSVAEKFRELIEKRKQRIPLAYLIGRAYFWNELLEVGPGCLIPRPETEKMIEVFLSHSGFKKEDAFSFLDLGCGLGAIGIALLREFPNVRAAFTDISKQALDWTRKNLKRYGLEERAENFHSDLFSHFDERSEEKSQISRLRLEMTRKWNAILCNPPYLSASDWQTVAPEILAEPREALDGGPDGLNFYRRIAREAGHFLAQDGQIYFEAGKDQAEKVSELLAENSFKEIKIFKDDLGIERVVAAQWIKS